MNWLRRLRKEKELDQVIADLEVAVINKQADAYEAELKMREAVTFANWFEETTRGFEKSVAGMTSDIGKIS